MAYRGQARPTGNAMGEGKLGLPMEKERAFDNAGFEQSFNATMRGREGGKQVPVVRSPSPTAKSRAQPLRNVPHPAERTQPYRTGGESAGGPARTQPLRMGDRGPAAAPEPLKMGGPGAPPTAGKAGPAPIPAGRDFQTQQQAQQGDFQRKAMAAAPQPMAQPQPAASAPRPMPQPQPMAAARSMAPQPRPMPFAAQPMPQPQPAAAQPMTPQPAGRSPWDDYAAQMDPRFQQVRGGWGQAGGSGVFM